MATGRGRRHEGAAATADLEVLDPVTGEAFDPGGRASASPSAAAGAAGGVVRSARSRRLRAAAWTLWALAFASGATAGWYAFNLSSVRAIDRSWAAAMALDRARKAADATVFELDRSSLQGTRGVDPAERAALGRIGEEVTAGLLAIEDDLRDRWIIDDRLDAVRDDMLDALRFRRFQLAPSRRVLGDTPLVRVEADLDVQLERFRLSASTARPPELQSLAGVLAELREFADVDTGTVLVAHDGRRLLTVDVDGDRITPRALPADAVDLVATPRYAVVQTVDGFVTAYPPEVALPPAWTLEGTGVVAGRRGSTVDAWVRTPSGAVAVVGDRPAPAVPLPDGAVLRADTDEGLLLEEAGRLHLHDPTSGRRVRTLPLTGRFAGASAAFVAVQLPSTTSLAVLRLGGDDVVFETPLPRTDAGQVVQAPDREEFVFAAGPLAGNFASVVTLEADGWRLVGMGGPRATVRTGAITWSPDGEWLFWVTPEGRIAYGDAEVQAVLRSPIEGAEQVVAFVASGRR